MTNKLDKIDCNVETLLKDVEEIKTKVSNNEGSVVNKIIKEKNKI